MLKDDYLFAPYVLSLVEEKALSYGYHCISCYTPFLPRSLPSHLLIPELGVSFISDSKLFPYGGEVYCSIDLNSTLSPRVKKELSFTHKSIQDLTGVLQEHLAVAKSLHDQIEGLCKPFVDFAAVTAMTEKVISARFM